MIATESRTITVPLNRVEGDLEVKVEIRDGVVTDAWSAGTMYRGFENMLRGRGAYDGLVITPRICGICGTAHLTAAALALESIAGTPSPPNATIARNIALMTEHVQSDLRHGILMFLADFANPAYSGSPLHEEAVRRFAPLQGSSVLEAVRQTRDLLQIVAIIGGQWPHSTYMVPGGTTTHVKRSEISTCRYLLDSFQAYYERSVLGCSLERWLQIESLADLDAWLDEAPAHRDSDLGFFLRFGREIGLDRIGRSHGNYLCYGQLDIPAQSRVRGRGNDEKQLVPGGFHHGGSGYPFEQREIAEHVSHSWYQDYEGGRHPHEGETIPYASGQERHKYSWAKAPRYNGLPAETGPLAEMVISGHPLFTDLIAVDGGSALTRELARLTRAAELLPAMRRWFDELDVGAPFYTPTERVTDGVGFGTTQASRGALGHWIKLTDGRIDHYQVITPTGWNCSPRDGDGVRGPWEEALVGTPVADETNPIELGHVVRSFDACLVCCVHTVRGSQSLVKVRV